ncbi:regulator of chromosome condensation 1/beta-lactamase-inhibitor protein II [Jimgerdemannia flammicorona]|uniref:Regulator of chromosome condensation 1/beta-lactamase-inhibitor protein II n=1 Tax=Jimgerdemannia flammicorona TaxID=994334 RepID=A0A433QMZ7_9FUNG|nr:regulator of chromosome condensation 1/beta-lactamase-inhibitor protein II [Jimgerdemannia flammicorona]
MLMATETVAETIDPGPHWGMPNHILIRTRRDGLNPGKVLLCGSTDWNNINRKTSGKNATKLDEKTVDRPQLLSPHIMRDAIDLKYVMTCSSVCNIYADPALYSKLCRYIRIYNTLPSPPSPNLHLTRVTAVITGHSACHSVLLTLDGEVYVFGRNEKGQLGLGDTEARYTPVNITSCGESRKALGKSKIVKAAVGRNHTILVAGTYSPTILFGCESTSRAVKRKLIISTIFSPTQLGLSTLQDHTKVERVLSLAKETIKEVACGADFTIVVNGFGLVKYRTIPDFATSFLQIRDNRSHSGRRSMDSLFIMTLNVTQLGNGSDGQYIKSAGQLVTAPQQYPLMVKGFAGKHIVSVACGANHTIALDKDGYVYSWGFGGYGRLGHGEQKDLHVPQTVAQFASLNELTHAQVIACGSTCSMALDKQQQLWMWGKWKNTGDGSSGQPWMNPKFFYDLNGWKFRGIAGGNASLFALAEKDLTTIAWGQVQNGELGFGEDSQFKSSTKPQRVEPLEGVEILSVSCGMGHTLLLAKAGNEKLADLPKFPELEEKGEACVKCGKDDDDDKILLCDKCDAPQHMYCANPKLESIPEGDWFCDACHRPAPAKAQSEEVEESPMAEGSSSNGAAEDSPTGEEESKTKKRGRPKVPDTEAGAKASTKAGAKTSTKTGAKASTKAGAKVADAGSSCQKEEEVIWRGEHLKLRTRASSTTSVHSLGDENVEGAFSEDFVWPSRWTIQSMSILPTPSTRRPCWYGVSVVLKGDFKGTHYVFLQVLRGFMV